MKFFLPKQVVFYDLLQEVAHEVKAMAVLFEEFADKYNNFETYAKRAKEIERRADIKSHAIIEKLNKTFITPFDREDIYQLAHDLDDIVDFIENVIHNVYLYQLTRKIPAFDQFAPLIKEASLYLEKMLHCLAQQKYSDELMKVKIKIHELEDKGDEAFGNGVGNLFRDEKDPIFVVKAKDILESLENIMDKYQVVSDIIEGIIVKST